MRLAIIFIIFIIIESQQVTASNILAIFQDPSYSHEYTYHKILKGLADRGHKLTIFGAHTFDYNNNPNVTQHVFKQSMENYRKNFNITYGQQRKMHWLQMITMHETYACYKKSHDDIEHPEMQKMIKNGNKTEKYDLIIMECAFCQLALLAEVHDCPIIQFTASEPSVASHQNIGNDVNPAVYSDSTRFPYLHGKLTFWERLSSVTYHFVYLNHLSLLGYIYYMNKITTDHPFPNVTKHAHEVYNSRLALMIANTSPEIGHVRTLSPYTIQIGFFHVDEPKELTNFEVKSYLDASTNGVIIMSFGSAIKTADIGTDSIEKFLKAFNMTTYNILWKFDEPIEQHKIPKNVKLTKWMPLSDVLAHPNVKIIIHHGGLLTCYESIAREVPQIIFPLVYDEGANARLLASRQVAIEMDLDEFDEIELEAAIRDVTGPTFKQNIKLMKSMALDQPINKRDLAIFHIEKVIRHKGRNRYRIDVDNSVSHATFHHSYMKGLIDKGHSATIFTTYLGDYGGNPNVTQIHMTKSIEIHKNHTDMLMYKKKNLSWLDIMLNYELKSYLKAIDYEMELPEMQDIIHNSTKYKFDLIIIECYFCTYFNLAEVYDCPIIITGSSDVPAIVHELMGNAVDPTEYCDSEFLPYMHRDMTIPQQFHSTALYLFLGSAIRLYMHIKQRMLDMKYFGHIKSTYDAKALNNIALLMTNTNPAFGHVRPMMTDTIQIGLSHIRDPQELQDMELKKYLDESQNGVVVMALGSRADPKSLGIENVKKFMSGFNMTNMNVLWKLHGVDDGVDVADNVKIVTWMPLFDVMAHPNVKLLIFHGGLLTSYEAIDREVPMIVFPLVFDQYINTRHMSRNGVAMEMDLNNFDDVSLAAAIEEMRKDKYADNVKVLRHRMYDRPMKSKDFAVWNIEKVLRSPNVYKRSANAFYEKKLLHMFLYIVLLVMSLKYLKNKIYNKN
ncbi:UDP-glucuronosyltransferase 1A8-like [Chironomus tepperi]|uniref:UDP-glucuronosyltransferase 1A8-like n=1 Tax=Chironomus tepperi TaxID=113505 RepID=UPI00391F14D1